MAQDQLILDRYRPIAEAGSGGFATVQLAWDTRIQRQVAIKCIELDENDQFRVVQDELRARYGAEAVATQSFSVDTFDSIPGLDEARTAAMLQDPHIVGVFDFEVRGSMAYLIMEYIDGVTLTQLLAEYELDLDEVAAIFSSIAAALEMAHAHQVLHLDIKPDNILINRQGQVKVTDFGLATLSDAMGFAVASGGTIGYMPLEQMRQESLDVRCDEWALASVTYEMLMDDNPFRANDLRGAALAIEDAELVLTSVKRDDVDPALDDVLFYALDPDREERYETVSDFAEEMGPLLGNSARGHKKLATLVGQAAEEIEVEAAEESRRVRRRREGPGVFERLSAWLGSEEKLSWRGRALLIRIWAVLGSGVLAAAALGALVPPESEMSPIIWAGVLLCVVGAAITPWLGALLSLLALCVTLFYYRAIVLGLILVVAVGAWWFFAGRKGSAAANIALIPGLFGIVGLGVVTPLASGFTLRLREALITSALGIFLALILAGLGSGTVLEWPALDALGLRLDAINDPTSAWLVKQTGFASIETGVVALLVRPTTWCVIVGWLASTALMSLLCSRGNRLLAGIGVLAGVALLTAGLALGTGFETGFRTFMLEVSALVSLGVALVGMIAACVIGVPERPHETR